MKKLFSLFVIVFVFSGCTTEVTTNTPGFQAFKDDTLWRAIDVKAYLSLDGHLRILAMAENEQVELNLSSSNVGTYYFASIDDENTADYSVGYNGDFLRYLTYDINGPILNINNPVIISGTGYSENFNVSTTSLSGGSGMTVDTTVSDSGFVTGVLINSSGSDYEAGDIITINGGDNNAKFKILSVVEITENTNGTLTGTFRFTAKNAVPNPTVNELVSFQYGSFYQIPVIPEL
jgi:hypothetical protein